MTRETFGIGLSRIAALAFALVATVAVALAIAPGPALANTGAPGTGISPEGAGTVMVEEVEGNAFKFTATAKDAYEFESWTVKYGEYTYSGGTANPTTQSFDEPGMAVVTANFKLKSAKQDWTGTTTVEGSALYGETGTVSIYGYLPTDTNVEIPEGSVSVSDPDGVLDSWSFNNVDGIVTYTFVNDSSKSGKQATISATVKSDKYNDYTGSVVLTVLGKVPTTYKISVSSDPSAGGTATADKQEAAAGDIVKLTATPADRSWEFVGWKTDPAVTITDDAFTMPSSNVSVTAVFKKASTSTYAITFNANGGSGTMAAVQVDDGASYTLPACTFSAPSGKVFDKWDKGAVDTSITVTADTTVKAQWKDAPEQPDDPTAKAMHRLYNPNSGEHFYTADESERDDVIAAGWTYEGIGWYAPGTSSTQVFRLYNSNAGEHFYTADESERDDVIAAGWTYEGVGWYSDDAKAVPLYRDYNPNAFANNHNYTVDAAEHQTLMDAGWNDEGYACWYGVYAA